MIDFPKITFENEDCFSFLSKIPDCSIDLVLIDPPYCISRQTKFHQGSKPDDDLFYRQSMDFGKWDYNFNGMTDVVRESHRIFREGGTFISFYDLWKITHLRGMLETARFKTIRFMEWVKSNPVPINSRINYLTNAREIAVLGVKSGGKATFNSKFDNGIYNCGVCHDVGRFHPTQKPLALIEEIILKHSNEGDVVLDCFAGSGTTAVACHNENRRFVGCEISTEYYEKSLERLNGLGITVGRGDADGKNLRR